MLFKPRGKKGKTIYNQMQQVVKSLGKWPEGFAPIPPPENYAFLWAIFWELRNHSKSGFSGTDGLSFHDLDAWQRVRRRHLDGWLVDMILEMDSAYLAEWYRDRKNGH